jgi:hypothetical protein
MMAGQGRKEYTPEFKREAVDLVTEQGYTLVGAAPRGLLLGHVPGLKCKPWPACT